MAYKTIMIQAVFMIFICSLFLWYKNWSDEALAANKAMFEASEIFTDWWLRNPGIYIGLSEEGRLLLSRYIEAYDWFLKTHEYIDGKEYREYLVSLLYELPPKDPKRMPRDKKGTISGTLFILSHFTKKECRCIIKK